MKFDYVATGEDVEPSLPVRGAWIEMRQRRKFAAFRASLPVRGAWIEIGAEFRSAHHDDVAPHAGSVD